MNVYVQFAIGTGLGLLTTYVMRSNRITPERKTSFMALMAQVNVFVADIENPAPLAPTAA